MLVFEDADGGSLREYLKNKFQVSDWNQRIHFAMQLANVLKCLHERDIIHGYLVNFFDTFEFSEFSGSR